MAKSSTTPKPAATEKMTNFFLPEYGVTIVASSIDEAINKAKKGADSAVKEGDD